MNKIRRSGFYKDEEDELLRFCLSDDYPRSITIERTGTNYKVDHPRGARYLWRRLRGISARRESNDEHYSLRQQDRLIMEANEKR